MLLCSIWFLCLLFVVSFVLLSTFTNNRFDLLCDLGFRLVSFVSYRRHSRVVGVFACVIVAACVCALSCLFFFRRCTSILLVVRVRSFVSELFFFLLWLCRFPLLFLLWFFCRWLCCYSFLSFLACLGIGHRSLDLRSPESARRMTRAARLRKRKSGH